MHIKKLSMLVVMVACLFLISGGQVFGAPESFEGEGLAPVTDETIYFRGWQYKTHIVKDNVDRYNTELNGNVDYATVTGDYPSIMQTKFIAKAPTDILYANPNNAIRYYEAGWILPAETLPNIDRIKADMYPSFVEAWTHKGNLIGLSYFTSDEGMIHVNLKKLEEAGLPEADLPATWDELWDQLYVLRERGIKYPFLPRWFNEFYGISWAFGQEVLNRGGQIADPETHAPMVTVDGPAGDALRDWKRVWNDGLVPEEILSYLEPDFLESWGSGEYVYSAGQSYDLKKFNDPRYSRFAGYCSFIPYKGQSWGFLGPGIYLMSSRPRSKDHTRDVQAFYSWYGYRDHKDEVFVGQRWMAESMLFSAYRPVMEHPKTKALMVESLARPEDYDKLLDLYEHCPYPKGTFNVVWGAEFYSWLKEKLQRFLLDDKPVDETIHAIRDQINELNRLYAIS